MSPETTYQKVSNAPATYCNPNIVSGDLSGSHPPAQKEGQKAILRSAFLAFLKYPQFIAKETFFGQMHRANG